MENNLSALMAQIAAAEKAGERADSPFRVATRMIGTFRSGEQFVGTSREPSVQAQRNEDMQNALGALGEHMRFTADDTGVVDPENFRQYDGAADVTMEARYGVGTTPWKDNEKAQQLALGLFALMKSIKDRYGELKRSNSLNDDDAGTLENALMELQRLAVGAQPIDHNMTNRLQAVGAALYKLQTSPSNPSGRDFDDLPFAIMQGVGHLAAPYEDRANPQHEPRYRGESLLKRND